VPHQAAQERGQHCCGTRAAADKLALKARLNLQRDPTRVIGTCDERNGFNCISRDAIGKGLEALPKKLWWLRQAYKCFYSSSSELIFMRDEDGAPVLVTCRRGVHQGDGAGMALFACGMDAALMKLRGEFAYAGADGNPSATIDAFADDVMFDAEAGRVVCTDELRPFEEGAVSMPTSAAVIQRWRTIAEEDCSLEVRIDKCHVARRQTVLTRAEFGAKWDEDEQALVGGVGVEPGFLIMGIPVGKPAWERETALRLTREGGVHRTYDVISECRTKQLCSLLGTFCGGVTKINHLLRCLETWSTDGVVSVCDTETEKFFCELLGRRPEDLTQETRDLMAAPLRHGGLGCARASDRQDAAIIGGWAASAYLGYGLGSIDANLARVCEKPDEFSALPFITSTQAAWRVVMQDAHLRRLVQAAVAGIDGHRPENSADGDGDVEATFERSWGKDVLKGVPLQRAPGVNGAIIPAEHTQIDAGIDAAVEVVLARGAGDAGAPSDLQRHMITHPEEHLEALSYLARVGWVVEHWPVQKLISRALARSRFVLSFAAFSPERQELVRGHLNPNASRPLYALPCTAQQTLQDDAWLWHATRRLGLKQPCTLGLKSDTCKCGKPIGDGYHLRVCRQGGGATAVHNSVRDVVRACCAHAGVNSRTEEPGLLEEGEQRPADVFAEMPGGDTAYDCVLIDNCMLSSSQGVKRRRRRTVGEMARIAARKKERGRSGARNMTMVERLRERNIRFVPLAFEVGGAETGEWSKLLKKLSEIAHSRRGHDPTYFRQRWSMEMAMCLAHRGARAALRRMHANRHDYAAPLGDGALCHAGAEAPLMAPGGGG
jgi:hypothetical protein